MRRPSMQWRDTEKHQEPGRKKGEEDGGARRDRTADLVIANDALSQLSYGPICRVG